ncbi:alpha/beta fold hydrolase [Tellurirhabdus rosea]|uniref:alpha/beta fold hydrolase n=1 Tax=Tellurirhabdus rosea TaxID=2674997 RepID=UPI00225AFA85|nr:alpha/beta hydrolase [Tellurirhabdus rosea]
MRLLLTLVACLLAMAAVAQKAADNGSFFFTTSDSTRLYVRVAGKGQPCLFLHGGPGSTSHYFEASDGRRVEDFMQMIYIDLRGSGRSGSAPSGDYSIARLEKDLEELRRYLGHAKWTVMGHSFAGLLLTNYAAYHPDRIRSLVYVNCTLNLTASAESWIDFGIRELKLQDTKALKDPAVPALQRMGLISEKLNEKGVWYKLMFATPEAKAKSDSVSFQSFPEFNFEYGQKVWGNPEYMQDYTPLTAKISAPTLVVTGARDFAVGPEHYKAFRFPNSRVAVYDGGHCPFQEGGDWFVNEVRQFVK